MRSTMTTIALEPLSQTRLDLADPNEDVRDRKVFDRDGQEIGRVEDAFIDPTQRRTRFVSVKSGDFLGIGGKKFLIPVEAIASVDQDRLVINEKRDRIVGGPQVDGQFKGQSDKARSGQTGMTGQTGKTGDVDATPLVIEVYEWYRVAEPFWSPNYQRPNWR